MSGALTTRPGGRVEAAAPPPSTHPVLRPSNAPTHSPPVPKPSDLHRGSLSSAAHPSSLNLPPPSLRRTAAPRSQRPRPASSRRVPSATTTPSHLASHVAGVSGPVPPPLRQVLRPSSAVPNPHPPNSISISPALGFGPCRAASALPSSFMCTVRSLPSPRPGSLSSPPWPPPAQPAARLRSAELEKWMSAL
jgi:hypothetical protein